MGPPYSPISMISCLTSFKTDLYLSTRLCVGSIFVACWSRILFSVECITLSWRSVPRSALVYGLLQTEQREMLSPNLPAQSECIGCKHPNGRNHVELSSPSALQTAALQTARKVSDVMHGFFCFLFRRGGGSSSCSFHFQLNVCSY